MKIILTASLVLLLTFSIVFASTNDAFAQVNKPKTVILTLDKVASPSIGLNPTTVTYTYTVKNMGTEACFARSTFPGTGLFDSAFGTIPIPNTTLLPGQTKIFTVTKIITATTTNVATFTCRNDPGVFFSASDTETVQIFAPSITVTKDGDTLSKVGDDVTYDITITSTSTSNSPNLLKDSITDTLLGDLTAIAPPECSSLAPGASCTFSVTRTVMPGDPDPLENTVTVHYHPAGFGATDVTDTDDHSVNLFQPSITVTKDGDTLSKVGDDVTYDITITSTSSGDSPDLMKDSIADTLLGDLTAIAPPECSALAPGESCTFSVTRTVMPGDPDPLENTVTVHYHPDGFPNDITDSDDHSVNLFEAAIVVTKDGPASADVGDLVTYDITFTYVASTDAPDAIYDSSMDSLIGPLDGAALPDCAVLAPGDSCSFSIFRTVEITDPNPLVNTVTAHYHPEGFPNDLEGSDSHSLGIIVLSAIDVIKMADPSVVDAGGTVTYTVDITNTGLTTITDIECIDDNSTPADGTDDIDVDALMGGPFSLVPGEDKTFTYDKEVFVDSKNTVECIGIGPDGPVGDMSMAQVIVLVVGGAYLGLDGASLALAGIQAGAVWLVPTIAGFAGIGFYLIKFRNKEF